jgi:anti-sigma regulatory factor (Ser/Thr protein kinase)
MTTQALAVSHSSQVAEARRAVVGLAAGLAFDETDRGRAAIVATELATNLVKHGGGGELLAASFDDETGSGLQLIALDKGQGIARIADALRDGFSSAGSAGQGLGAARRQSQAFDIASWPGQGTAVLARLRAGRHAHDALDPFPTVAGVGVPKPGESVCGDDWWGIRLDDRIHLLVADGLGHGLLAAQASGAAVGAFRQAPWTGIEEMLGLLHAALRSTRGAAVAISEVDLSSRTARYGGIGNIAGAIAASDSLKRMVSHNGTAGHTLQKIQAFSYAVPDATLVIMQSDGVSTGWSLARYPGLASAHPALVAGVLYRDFARGRDDATVAVARTVR